MSRHSTCCSANPPASPQVHQLDSFTRDVSYAIRQLARAPGFTVVAVLTLALGIGANAAIFGVVDEILLKPPPYRDPDRIVTLWQNDRTQSATRDDVSPANFFDWRERSETFEALAAVEPYSMDYLGPEGPDRFPMWLVTEGFHRVFGVGALLGRTFTAEDHTPSTPQVAMLSFRLWQTRFGADPAIVGRVLTLDGRPLTVVGVMPPQFSFPAGNDVWVPKVPRPGDAQTRAGGYWRVVGRLADGVALEAAQAELDAIATALAAEYPATNADIGIAAVPIAEYLVGDVRPALLLFWGAVGAVLLIACVNVANLLLARAAQRRRELALRAVLGAGRARLVRQLVTESLLLAVLGGMAGLAVATSGLGVIEALRPAGFFGGVPLAVDGRVIGFTALLALGTAFLFGLAPALDAAAGDLRARLHTTTLAPARRFRGILVVGELALAMALLIAAGLLVRSFVTLQQVERGYRSDNVFALTVQAWRYFPDLARRTLFVEEALERIGALPGVQAVGIASSLPLAEDIGQELGTFAIEGHPPASVGDEPVAHVTVATNGYFAALGIPLRAGRLFALTDRGDMPRVVVINEAMARRYWPGEDPVGATLTVSFLGYVVPPARAEVVGVVADVRLAPQEEPRPSLFVPHAQVPTGALHFTMRAAGDPTPLIDAVRRELWAANAAMPIEGPITLEGLLDDAFSERRFTLTLVLLFSGTALVLASVGAYGLSSYEASRRSNEIGVRMALGADRGRVVRFVVGAGLKLALIGIGIGALLALATSRLLSGFLYGVSPFDPWTFAGIAALLLGVTALASFLPAHRAARLNPMITLRAE